MYFFAELPASLLRRIVFRESAWLDSNGQTNIPSGVSRKFAFGLARRQPFHQN
jgi:hypothetical protein